MLALARRSLPPLRLDPSNYVPIDKIVRLAPVSNRVGTGSDEELLLVEMQHVRYGVSMSVPLLRLDPSNYVPFDKCSAASTSVE